MQPNLPGEGSDDPVGYDLSFPHIKLATPEDELMNKSLLESLAPSSPNSSAPYRLPKLSTGSVSSGSTCTSTSERSDGPPRDGSLQDAQSPRSVKSKRSSQQSSRSSRMQSRISQQLPNPPYTIAQLRRAQNIHVPTFKKAQFSPLTSPVRATEVPRPTDKERVENAEQDAQRELRETQMTRASTHFTHASRSSYGARSAAVSMTIPIAKGAAYSRPPDQKPEWRLSPYRHKNYDNQAVSPNFGPYSRGFVIHCSTPKSWLQMKLRRTKTTLL